MYKSVARRLTTAGGAQLRAAVCLMTLVSVWLGSVPSVSGCSVKESLATGSKVMLLCEVCAIPKGPPTEATSGERERERDFNSVSLSLSLSPLSACLAEEMFQMASRREDSV